MVYGAVTGAFLITGARADTNIVWLEDFADIGQVSVDWYRRTDRLPDVILVSTDAVQGDGFEAFSPDATPCCPTCCRTTGEPPRLEPSRRGSTARRPG